MKHRTMNLKRRKKRTKLKKKKLKRRKKEFTMKNLGSVSQKGLYMLPSSSEGEISEDERDGSLEENVATLKRIGYPKELKLLQDLLLEMCYLKLDCSARHMAEPHVWPYASVGKSVPMVAYTQGQELLQQEEIFSSLMKQLGIQKDSSHLFPTIPSFWTAEMCFETASKLGPLNPVDFKFAVTELGRPKFDSQRTFLPEELGKEASMSSDSSKESVRDLAYRLPGSSWLMMVQAGNLC